MKKSILIAALLGCAAYGAQAQISKGGLPQSLQSEISLSSIPVSRYAAPDWNQYLQQEKEQTTFTSPFRVALYAAADFGFPQSGQLITLDNGQRVWRGQIAVADAPAIGLLYDRFNLPKGVRLFLTNANRKQVVGAFDIDNNDPSGTFITDAVQGSVVTVELDIDPAVNINDIQLHVDRAAVYHRAIEHLQSFAGVDIQPWDQNDNILNGSSSVCMVNAICPQGANYANNRKATVQLLLFDAQGPSVCSGTLVNNTSNTSSNCKPYLLTATHCESTGSTSSATFNQTIVRFNFEHSACTGSPDPTSQSMVGLNFVARAAYNSNVAVGDIKGDFMLFAFRQTIPASYGAILSGWNNNAAIPTTVSEPKKFIGFHHPDGDNKKLSYTHQIQSGDLGAANTHWEMLLENSYGAEGSSGSGLFDGNGYLIGQLSVGGDFNVPSSCLLNADGEETTIGDYVGYSKFSYVWDYSIDGNASNRKLKPWLDPAATGATTLNALKSNCTAVTTSSISDVNNDLSDNISLFPNPSTNGNITIQYNLPASRDIKISVLDLSGKVSFLAQIPKALNGTRKLDLSALSNGMYMITFSTEDGFTSKKVMIQK